MSRSQLSIDLEDFLGYEAPIPTDAFVVGIRPRAPLPRRSRHAYDGNGSDVSDLSSWPNSVAAATDLRSRRRPREISYDLNEDLEAQRRALVGRPSYPHSSRSRVTGIQEEGATNSETTVSTKNDAAELKRHGGPYRRLESNRAQLSRECSEARDMERQQQHLIATLTSRLDDMDARFQAQVTELSEKLEKISVNVGEKYDSIYSKMSDTIWTRAEEVSRLEQELRALNVLNTNEFKSCRDSIVACRADLAKLESRLEGVLSHPSSLSVAVMPSPSSTAVTPAPPAQPSSSSTAFNPGGSGCGGFPPTFSATAALSVDQPSSSQPSPSASTAGTGFGLGTSMTAVGGFGGSSFGAKPTERASAAPATTDAASATAETPNASTALASTTAASFDNPFGTKAADTSSVTNPFSFCASSNTNGVAATKPQGTSPDKQETSANMSAFGGASSSLPTAANATPSTGESKLSAFGGGVTGTSKDAAAPASSGTVSTGFSFPAKPVTPPVQDSSAVTSGFKIAAAVSDTPSASPFSFTSGGATSTSVTAGGNPFMTAAANESSSPKPSPFGGAVASQQAPAPATTTFSAFDKSSPSAHAPGSGGNKSGDNSHSGFGGATFSASATPSTGAQATSAATFSFGTSEGQMPNVPSAPLANAAGVSSLTSTAQAAGSTGSVGASAFGASTAGSGGSSSNSSTPFGNHNTGGATGSGTGAFGSGSFSSNGAFPSSTAPLASTPFSSPFGAGGGAPSNAFNVGGAPATAEQGKAAAQGANMAPPKPVGAIFGGGSFNPNTNTNANAFGASAGPNPMPTNAFPGASNTAGTGGSSAMFGGSTGGFGSSSTSGSAPSVTFGSKTNNSNTGNPLFPSSSSGPAAPGGGAFGAVPVVGPVPVFGSNPAGGSGPSGSSFGAAPPAFSQPIGASPAFGGPAGGAGAMRVMGGSSQGTSILGSNSSRKKAPRRY